MCRSTNGILSRDLLLANDLPLGVLAEDAAESCNKLYRHNRQFHARNASRQKNLMDVFNRALDTTDPIISSFSLQKRLNSRRRQCLPTDVLQLLKGADATGRSEVSEVDETLLANENDDDDEILDEIFESLDELNLPETPLNDDDCDYNDEEYYEDDDDDE